MRSVRRTSSLVSGWLACAALAALAANSPALALDNLKILAAGGPGGGLDQTARALQGSLQASKIVNKVTVDSKPGAGGTIALAQFITSSKGNPNALLVAGAFTVGAVHVNKSPVNFSQVTPLARLTGEYGVVVVAANSKIQSMQDLIAQFKANPGSVSWGGGSVGGTDHVLAAMIAQAVGVEPSKVNYIAYPAGGGEVQAATMGGHVTAGISGYGEFAGQIKSGKLRALGISSDKRIPGVDIPTLKEQGIDVELSNWRGVFGAPGINDAQRKALLDAVEDAVKSATWQEALKRNEWTSLYLAGDEFKAFLDAEDKRIGSIMQSLGVVKK